MSRCRWWLGGAFAFALSTVSSPGAAQSPAGTSGSGGGALQDLKALNATLGAVNEKRNPPKTLADCIRWVRSSDGQTLRVLALGAHAGDAALFPTSLYSATSPPAAERAFLHVDSEVVVVGSRKVGEMAAGEEHRLPLGLFTTRLTVRVGDKEHERQLRCESADETLEQRAADRQKQLARGELDAALGGMSEEQAGSLATQLEDAGRRATASSLSDALDTLRKRGAAQQAAGAEQRRIEVPGQYTYEGAMRGNAPHGQGKLTFANGAACSGEFINGDLPRGRCTDPKGGWYEGDLKRLTPEGRGQRSFPDDTRYQGPFVDGREHGEGALTAPDGTRLEGTWTRGELKGEIRVTYPDGWTFRGPYSSGNVARPNGHYYDASGKLRVVAPFFPKHPT